MKEYVPVLLAENNETLRHQHAEAHAGEVENPLGDYESHRMQQIGRREVWDARQ